MKPSSPYQLIISDADGTLLDSNGRVSVGGLEAIHAAQERGITVCLATGRGYFLAMPLVDLLGIRDPIILSGGALILSPAGAVIDSQPLSPQATLEVAAYARQHGLGMSFHEPGGVYAEADDATWRHLTTRNWFPDEPEAVHPFKRVRDVLSERPPAPLRVDVFGPDELVFAQETRLAARFPDLMVMRVYHHLEITRRGVNKGSAVQRLAEYLRIPLSATFVIGDDINDVAMFQVAGMAVAMGNGTPELRAMAAAVAPGNNEGGFAWAMREFVL